MEADFDPATPTLSTSDILSIYLQYSSRALVSRAMWEHIFVALSVAAIVAPFSYYSGWAASRFLKLPQITGYLISGIVCGPYVLGILSKESVLDLNIVEGACLAIIGLAAGAELDWGQLSKARKQVRLPMRAHPCLLYCFLTCDSSFCEPHALVPCTMADICVHGSLPYGLSSGSGHHCRYLPGLVVLHLCRL